ncbi:class I glutamine amidotransferase-like protein [Aspergillus sclerotioniger CBS 115572]|uniref:D-lactate dehydratase n=1 Tax=Aspergillus sclerotioniger CBS 115572 TaxID=1450535 RepID=A0A317X698_9EURO|nr:class I glutamine amidotransferase-like protein [Aspergillus sclerotioniger CBS 115572]PWY94134.1 class I glutamine amidotransferase-like protein [Aspergillus sclerotioniger CBS 115572]
MAPKILFVLTSCGEMSNGKPTGWYLPEFARPYYHLVGDDEANPQAEIIVASPAGGMAPIDEGSVKNFQNDPISVKFFESQKKLWETTKPLKDFLGKASEFDAIFYPGGHGPMFDLVKDKTSLQLIEEFYKAGKTVAAVCHGPIVFVNATVDGKPLLEGRRATGFSNAEEDAVGLTGAMPVLLEDEVKRVGGNYVKAEQLWKEMVVVDGQIITGQNPASAQGVGVALATAVGL